MFHLFLNVQTRVCFTAFLKAPTFMYVCFSLYTHAQIAYAIIAGSIGWDCELMASVMATGALSLC